MCDLFLHSKSCAAKNLPWRSTLAGFKHGLLVKPHLPRTQLAQALVAWWHGFAPKADGIMLGFQEGSKKYYAYLRNTNCISLCLHHKLLLGEVDLKPLPCWPLHESRPYLDKDRLLDLELHPVKWSLNDNRPFCKPMTIWLVFPCSILQHAATFNNQTGVWALKESKMSGTQFDTVAQFLFLPNSCPLKANFHPTFAVCPSRVETILGKELLQSWIPNSAAILNSAENVSTTVITDLIPKQAVCLVSGLITSCLQIQQALENTPITAG